MPLCEGVPPHTATRRWQLACMQPTQGDVFRSPLRDMGGCLFGSTVWLRTLGRARLPRRYRSRTCARNCLPWYVPCALQALYRYCGRLGLSSQFALGRPHDCCLLLLPSPPPIREASGNDTLRHCHRTWPRCLLLIATLWMTARIHSKTLQHHCWQQPLSQRTLNSFQCPSGHLGRAATMRTCSGKAR